MALRWDLLIEREREREGAHHTEKEAVKSGSSGSDGEITAARSIQRELIG